MFFQYNKLLIKNKWGKKNYALFPKKTILLILIMRVFFSSKKIMKNLGFLKKIEIGKLL